MRRMLRYFLPVPLLLFACSSQGVRDVPHCPPCPCLRDLGARPDLAAVADLSAPPDMTCEARVGASCVDIPCCPGLTCVGGACALVTAR